MTRTKISESAFRHYVRVRMGVNGPKGRLMHCARRDGEGKFWKVRLDSGEWVWPDRLILDGPGTHVCVCSACELSFMSEQVNDVLCPICEGEPLAVPSDDIRKPRAYLHGARTTIAKPAPATSEQVAEVERLRRELEDESPF